VGEPVYRRDLEAFRAHFTDTCTFINRLGSTETGTIRWYFAGVDDEVAGVNVPVGYPVPGNEILLLDDAGNSVPDGETGEIVVRSSYLSPGYWRRPDLTKKAFFETDDRRCFHTGDIGRMLPGGCLVHLGRRDFQIKVRGYRIEAGEVEAALLTHPAVKDALVIVREDRQNDPRLVAYYTIEQREPRPTVSELRRHLAGCLPDYMVPNAFVLLPEFPLAPNGKIDRSALPPVGAQRPHLETTYVEPRTPIERTLADLWKKLLDLDDVGIHDSFLDLGGHSLLATGLFVRIREVFGIDLEIRCLFEDPSIEALAEHVLERMLAADEKRSESDGTSDGSQPRAIPGDST
jgi:acyl carrier protein